MADDKKTAEKWFQNNVFMIMTELVAELIEKDTDLSVEIYNDVCYESEDDSEVDPEPQIVNNWYLINDIAFDVFKKMGLVVLKWQKDKDSASYYFWGRTSSGIDEAEELFEHYHLNQFIN